MLGHLDAEARLAEPAIPLPAAARRRLSAAAGVLRALALPGDRLWTPEPLDQRALPEIDWLPAPHLCSGDAPIEGALIPWATVPGVGPSAERPAEAEGLPLVDALRRAPRPSLPVQRRVSHRRFASELATQLGVELPGAAWLADPDALRAHLTGFSRAPEAWVLKAPLSAAGQGLSVNRVDQPLAPAQLERVFARHGELLFEPWEARAVDFGLCAWIDEMGRTHVAGVHQLVSDSAGGFRGVVAPALDACLPSLSPAHEAQLRATGLAVGAALASAGHRGPFGIDAYLRAADSPTAAPAPAATDALAAPATPAPDAPAPESPAPGTLRALVEINARLSFGHLVHALRERARNVGFVAADRALALSLGSARDTPPSSACALVQPVDGQGLWAWIEALDLT